MLWHWTRRPRLQGGEYQLKNSGSPLTSGVLKRAAVSNNHNPSKLVIILMIPRRTTKFAMPPFVPTLWLNACKGALIVRGVNGFHEANNIGGREL